MRLSAAAVTEGCLNRTVWPLAMLKLDQLMTRLLDCWLMTVVLPLGVLMEPLPATTCPPWGLAPAVRVTEINTSERPAAFNHDHVFMPYTRCSAPCNCIIVWPHLYIGCWTRPSWAPACLCIKV